MNDGAEKAPDEYFNDTIGKMRLDWAMIQPPRRRNRDADA